MIPPPATAAVPVVHGGLFPVRRIFCVGRNYAAHAREMGADPDREPPFFFLKPADALLTGGADMPYPPATATLHHEIELVAAIGTGGANIAEADALDHVWGYAVGLDMTRRDLQGAGEEGRQALGHGQGLRPFRPDRRRSCRPRGSAIRTRGGSRSRSTAPSGRHPTWRC